MIRKEEYSVVSNELFSHLYARASESNLRVVSLFQEDGTNEVEALYLVAPNTRITIVSESSLSVIPKKYLKKFKGQ